MAEPGSVCGFRSGSIQKSTFDSGGINGISPRVEMRYPSTRFMPFSYLDKCLNLRACPLTAASSISVAAKLDGSIVQKTLGTEIGNLPTVRIGHPSGVMTMVPTVAKNGPDMNNAKVPGVAVQRTARRIMDGTLYIRH